MARLTAEDKFANKAAQKIRDRAYITRRNAYRDARDLVEKCIEAGPEAKAVDEARAAMEANLEARRAAQVDINDQIAVLKEKLLQVSTDYEAPLNAAKQARDDAWAKKDKLSRAELAKVDTQFADVANVQYVGAWEIPADVQALMTEAAEDARKAATAAADG